MLSKLQKIVQGTYIFLFILSTFAIVGNIELDIPVPTTTLIVYVISTFLTYGKVIYVNHLRKIKEEI